MHAFCMMLCLPGYCKFYFSRTKSVKIQINTPDSQLNYVEISCAITVQRRVNYGNLMNIFVYRNHVDY